ncbi:MAG: sulfite exporter TauE/SafE family protein [Phycisphaerae bacterium]|jgi:uncharacterized membrane protein YfcA
MLTSLDIVIWLELVLVGGAAGVLGGLLGIGGGIIMIPALAELLQDRFGPDSFHLYKLAAIATSIVLSIPAAIRHSRARAVVFRMLPGILPLAIVGVLVGVVGASYLSGEYTRLLKNVFGVFLELVVVFNIYQARRAAHGEVAFCNCCPMASRRGVLGTIVGLPAGLIAGMLGIGGGVWAVPAQRLFLGIRLRNAIANSTLMIVVVAMATAVTQSVAVSRFPGVNFLDGWYLAAGLAPGALVGGWCGAGLTHRLPTQWLRWVFLALLVAGGVRLILA